MSSKQPDRFDIDFENEGKSVVKTSNLVATLADKLQSVRNPYTGNKRKLLVNIFQAIENRGWEYETFIDLFSGSGMVSAAARHIGKSVISNDLSPYAYLNAKYFLELTNESLNQEDIEYLITPTLASEEHKSKGFVLTHYAERFAPDEIDWLDTFHFNLNMGFRGGRCGGTYANLSRVLAELSVLHYIMDHCFVGGRLNNGQVLAQLGHRVSHQRNDGKTMSFKDIKWLKPIITGPVGKAFNLDAIAFLQELTKLSIKNEIAYIDPPYGGQQSNYAEMYRFFNEFIEGGVGEKNPESIRFVSTRGYNEQFSELLDNCKIIPRIVLSYNDSSWCKIDDIVKAVKRFRTDVVVEEVKYDYNYRDKEVQGKEFIILAE